MTWWWVNGVKNWYTTRVNFTCLFFFLISRITQQLIWIFVTRYAISLLIFHFCSQFFFILFTFFIWCFFFVFHEWKIIIFPVKWNFNIITFFSWEKGREGSREIGGWLMEGLGFMKDVRWCIHILLVGWNLNVTLLCLIAGKHIARLMIWIFKCLMGLLCTNK